MRAMEEMRHWKIRDGSGKDLKGILSLRKIVFGEEEKDKLDEKFWRWEFEEGPDGKALIYIVEDENKIIGHFADIPRLFSVQGETVQVTSSVDLMVHPDYRQKGIFEAMARFGVEQVKQKKGLFMMGFAIRIASISGLKKIGWREVEELPVLVHPIRFRAILNRYLHFPLLSLLLGGGLRFFYLLLYGLKRKKKSEGIEIEKIDTFDDSFDHFWRKASSL